jgi:hypothetical protein
MVALSSECRAFQRPAGCEIYGDLGKNRRINQAWRARRVDCSLSSVATVAVRAAFVSEIGNLAGGGGESDASKAFLSDRRQLRAGPANPTTSKMPVRGRIRPPAGASGGKPKGCGRGVPWFHTRRTDGSRDPACRARATAMAKAWQTVWWRGESSQPRFVVVQQVVPGAAQFPQGDAPQTDSADERASCLGPPPVRSERRTTQRIRRPREGGRTPFRS